MDLTQINNGLILAPTLWWTCTVSSRSHFVVLSWNNAFMCQVPRISTRPISTNVRRNSLKTCSEYVCGVHLICSVTVAFKQDGSRLCFEMTVGGKAVMGRLSQQVILLSIDTGVSESSFTIYDHSNYKSLSTCMVSVKSTQSECSWLFSERHLALLCCQLHVCFTCELFSTVRMFLAARACDRTQRRRLRATASFVFLLPRCHDVDACVLTDSAHFHRRMLK